MYIKKNKSHLQENGSSHSEISQTEMVKCHMFCSSVKPRSKMMMVVIITRIIMIAVMMLGHEFIWMKVWVDHLERDGQKERILGDEDNGSTLYVQMRTA